MCHLYLTKCQYKSALINDFHVCLKMASPEHIAEGKIRVKTCLHVKACVSQARTTIDIFTLSVTEQSNDVLKQVLTAYEIYPHCHNYPKCEVL